MAEKRMISQEEIDEACTNHNLWVEESKGERADFNNCVFKGLSLKEMQFNGAVFKDCEFIDTDLSDVGFCFAEMNNVSFNNCKCRRFTAEEASFDNVRFVNCDLEYAVFTHSSLKEVSINDCKKEGIIMSRCYEPDSIIENIEAEKLRSMGEKEGLILQGCGGAPQEWLDGINDMLTEACVLQNGSKFKNISVFHHKGCTCILFPFEGVDLDVGKLAMWRLQTHEMFGGTWLSDYVPNRLGGFVTEEHSQEKIKPKCPLIGADGNIWSLMGIASNTLKHSGMTDEAKEMCNRITSSGSYDEALCILGEYVEICSEEDMEEDPEIDLEGGMSE